MKQNLINNILKDMLPVLNNEQLQKLQDTLKNSLLKLEISNIETTSSNEENYMEMFLSAKRIEGCSEKSLNYYKATIHSMLSEVNKKANEIITDDIRNYLSNYQSRKNSSKITIDNIRRILSSFFSWLEDEDYILKSPIRRIHKIKTGAIIKETISDENLETLRDNCSEKRDLAIIDMLASTGMRIGEMVLLEKEDIDFNERECIVFGKGNKERIV